MNGLICEVFIVNPAGKARQLIDARLEQSGWIVQDLKKVNPMATLGVAVREYPTSTGPVDYALFVDGKPVGVIEAKKDELGENITVVEGQSGRYANSTFRYITNDYRIRFVYEATGQLTRFTDYNDIKYRSRRVFSFHRPETLHALLAKDDTIRNNMKHFPEFDATGFRKCQITAIKNLDTSFAENRPRALVQMATGAGKTFTAITAAYRLLKFGKMRRILFLVDTKSLGEQAEREFLAYTPNDDNRSFAQLYGVRRLNSSYIPNDVQICISTIQRMYSILKGEEMDESAEEGSLYEQKGADSQPAKEVVYNEKYPPEFFDCIIVDECHRSIYNVWNQVLEYFDAFIIGLTATPDKRTFAFFNQNIVSEYSREQAIIDGVNVGEDIFLIETDVTRNGAHIMKQQIEYRDRLTRAKRWKQMDEDMDYTASNMDRDVVNPSQIRTVIRTFKECLPTLLFPHRHEVPKTLIFAKTDSHADDIIQIVREEFGEGNEFCQKITCQADRPETVLSAFRNDYYPRIAVTVAGLIATCNYFQVRLARQDKPIIIRGAIVRGNLYAENDVVFGQGFVDAYLMQEETAKYPRIIMTKVLIKQGDKVRSVYIDKKAAIEIEKEITERKRIESIIRELKQRKKILEKKLGIREYLPEKEVDYENYSLFMSQLAYDHKRLGTEGFMEKYDTSKYRGIYKRYLKGYLNYISGKKTENNRKSNKLILDPYTYLMYFKYGNKDVLDEELLKAIPEFLNQGLLITNVQEAVHE